MGQGNDGRVLVTCHRGIPCSVDEICKAVGLAVSDLMPPKAEKPLPEKVTWTNNYDFRDEDGTLLYQKQRGIKADGKKTFRIRRPLDGGGWEYNSNGVRKIIYNLPAVKRAIADNQTVFVVEGEKDADTLIEQGFIATTVPFGAGPGKWLAEYSESLKGGDIVVIADKDDSGRDFATEIRNALAEAGCTVELLIAPGPDNDGIKDVTDLLASGKSLTDLVSFEGSTATTDSDDEVDERKIYGDIADQIRDVLLRDDLNDIVKMTRVDLLLAKMMPETKAHIEGRLVNWAEFVKEDDDDSFDWVIPNLLERQERLMVVASEGVGKTFLARQVALLTAAGIHPFTFERMKPIRTLTVDLENPPRIIRRTSRDIQMKSLHYGYCTSPEAHLLIKPDGLDLMKSSDRAFLEEKIEEVKPDMLFLGPIYKSFIDPGGRTSESIAIEIAKYFDALRTYYNFAMWLEHHAPLGSSMSTRDLRPFGSAVWSRWPEFGLSLQPDPTATEGYVYEVKHFRGARDRRQFPTKMARGKTFPFEVLEFARMD